MESNRRGTTTTSGEECKANNDDNATATTVTVNAKDTKSAHRAIFEGGPRHNIFIEEE